MNVRNHACLGMLHVILITSVGCAHKSDTSGKANPAFVVKIKLDNNQGTLLPGMIADVSVVTLRNASAITVPVQSVVRDADNLTYVFVVDGENWQQAKSNLLEAKVQYKIEAAAYQKTIGALGRMSPEP